jgi:hypothetical protein
MRIFESDCLIDSQSFKAVHRSLLISFLSFSPVPECYRSIKDSRFSVLIRHDEKCEASFVA